jgi:phosphate uptake regulator
MRRKVIQIAESTQLISLPRKWAKEHNIKKGEELEVIPDGDVVIINSKSDVPIPLEKMEFDISGCQTMVSRIVGAIYRKGVDELKLTYDDPALLGEVDKALNKDTVGFEMLEQGNNYCVIKYVAGNIEEFNSILRRIFLLLNNMADETAEAFRTSQYARLKNLAFLEESNNRFTTICKRYLNKNKNLGVSAVGPTYHIIAQLEKIADQYKYLCQHSYNLDKANIKINKDVLQTFMLANTLIRTYYELYYKFDKEKILKIKEIRSKIIDDAHSHFFKKLTYADYWLAHHSISLANLFYELIGSCLVITLPSSKKEQKIEVAK